MTADGQYAGDDYLYIKGNQGAPQAPLFCLLTSQSFHSLIHSYGLIYPKTKNRKKKKKPNSLLLVLCKSLLHLARPTSHPHRSPHRVLHYSPGPLILQVTLHVLLALLTCLSSKPLMPVFQNTAQLLFHLKAFHGITPVATWSAADPTQLSSAVRAASALSPGLTTWNYNAVFLSFSPI